MYICKEPQTQTTMINVLVADDHQILIDGIRTILKDVPDIEIVAEAKDGYQVLKSLENNPDIEVVLMDINMPKLDGLDCTRQVHKRFPEVKVIALTQYSEKRFVKRMIKNGAMGYVLKDSERDILEEAIKTVVKGEKYFCDRLSYQLANQELKMENTSALFPKLSEREKEILNLICKEYSSQEIAEQLFLSFHTVESHRANLMQKAGVKNTAGLVRWAVQNDFVD